ncbi:hypothetical protein J3R83DRAFT_10394 [Lanmaoa asiatica]|nr:hypothetical protein J3R83DRAFT_10394 [Lanmaoa asiatica]
MSLLSQFQVDQGIGGGTPRHGRGHRIRQGAGSASLFMSLPAHTPAARTHSSPQWGSQPQSPPRYSPQASLEGTPSSLRRPRSPSDMVYQRAAKRSKRFAMSICRELHIEDDALNDFTELDTDEKLIVLYGKLIAIERAREREDVSSFIRSKSFKDIMKHRMRSCLLSPNLTGYVSDLPENVWVRMRATRNFVLTNFFSIQVFMKNHMALFKIPSQALEDPELSEFVDSLMKDVLTKQRSTMKTKITTAINTKMHISHLAKSLAPPGFYELTTTQWARFAFLHASLGTFTDLVNKSMEEKVALLQLKKGKLAEGDSGDADADANANANDVDSERSSSDEQEPSGAQPEKEKARSWNMTDYWDYVDCLLAELRSNLDSQGNLTSEQRRKKYDEFFTSCLQRDLKKYPATKRSAGIPAVDHLTSDLHRSIHQDLVW